jgi:hypothetical protein
MFNATFHDILSYIVVIQKVKLMMVNNSINNNKTNNHFSFQLIKHRIRQRHITLEIPDPGLGQAQTCGGVKNKF